MHRVFHLLQVEAIGVFAITVAPRTHSKLQIDHALRTAVVIERECGFGIASIHMTQRGEPAVVERFEVEVGIFLSGTQPPEASENFPFGNVTLWRIK